MDADLINKITMIDMLKMLKKKQTRYNNKWVIIAEEVNYRIKESKVNSRNQNAVTEMKKALFDGLISRRHNRAISELKGIPI